MKKDPIKVKGSLVDSETRCEHYNSPLDIIAIKFHCCNQYYPCYDCHAAETDHAASAWPRSEQQTRAVLCGGCKKELTINEYLLSNHQCPYCHRRFNPGCVKHHHLYFET